MDKEKLKKLINNFKNLPEIIASNSTYTESDTRSEFIDPFFNLLGWDMNNSLGLNSFNKEVIRENFQKINEEESQIPDYIFKLKNNKKIIVEAKKASVNIKNKEHAFQTRQYGYSAGLPISVLTNFREIRIFDTKVEPKIDDDIDNSILFECSYQDYLKNLDTINKFLGRTVVGTNEWNLNLNLNLFERPTINKVFLDQINKWRLEIAKAIKKSFSRFQLNEINYLSQKIINRFIFIRVCEDRELTKLEQLKTCSSSAEKLILLFEKYNSKFNSSIFKLEDEEDLLKDNSFFKTLSDLVAQFYHPISPYNFAVLYADFFGDIYEEYLINTITHQNGDLVLDKKDEYLDRDIVSTPILIVDRLLKETFERYSEENIQDPIILDPAMGSGRFLLLAFDNILSRQKNNNISIKEKIKILEKLFGIDKDYLAIDTAKFSLYLKILEGENHETLNAYSKLLPDLNKNIIFGNSIIGTDFEIVDSNIQPLDWDSTFNNKKFDIIVGNPPYVQTKDIKKNLAEYQYLCKKYITSYKQFDKYFSFIEKSLNYLSPKGLLSFVVPNSWINQTAGKNLRQLLSKHIYKIINFGDTKIFEEKSNYTSIIYLGKTDSLDLEYFLVNSLEDFWEKNNSDYFKINKKTIDFNKPLILFSNEEEKTLWQKIHNKSININSNNILTGIQTSRDKIYIIKDFRIENNYVFFSKDNKEWQIEKEICKPYISQTINLKSFIILEPDSLLIFPYNLEESNSKLIDLETLKTKYPYTFKYLENYKEELKSRDVSPPISNNEDDYYKYGRAQNISRLTEFPKIILTVNQKGDKYYLDNSGIYFTAGGTAGEIAITNNNNDKDYIYFLLGLLNQEAIEFYFSKRGSPKAGGYFTRGNDVMSNLPVPQIESEKDKELYKDIVKNVKLIVEEKNKTGLDTKNKLISENLINAYKSKVTKLFLILWERS